MLTFPKKILSIACYGSLALTMPPECREEINVEKEMERGGRRGGILLFLSFFLSVYFIVLFLLHVASRKHSTNSPQILHKSSTNHPQVLHKFSTNPPRESSTNTPQPQSTLILFAEISHGQQGKAHFRGR